MKKMSYTPEIDTDGCNLEFTINGVNVNLSISRVTNTREISGDRDSEADVSPPEILIGFPEKPAPTDLIQAFMDHMKEQGITINKPETIIELPCDPNNQMPNFNIAADILYQMEQTYLSGLQAHAKQELAKQNMPLIITDELVRASTQLDTMSIADIKKIEKGIEKEMNKILKKSTKLWGKLKNKPQKAAAKRELDDEVHKKVIELIAPLLPGLGAPKVMLPSIMEKITSDITQNSYTEKNRG